MKYELSITRKSKKIIYQTHVTVPLGAIGTRLQPATRLQMATYSSADPN